MSDVIHFRDTAAEIARGAGRLIQGFLNAERNISFKGERDMVTQVDQAAESFILDEITKRFPDHQILAEESGTLSHASSGYRWIIDPLDGTTNFVHGFPVYGVSIALEYGGEIIAGAVYDPTRDELFSAAQGCGAYLNDTRIHVSDTADLGKSLLATGFPYINDAYFSLNMQIWSEVYGKTQGLRRAGAAAIDMAWVACGRLDGYWEFQIHPWDIAAGILLVKEAGGTIQNAFGKVLRFEERCILASNSTLAQTLIRELAPYESTFERLKFPSP